MTPAAVVGLGVDSVDVPRFAALLQRRPAFAARAFTDGELAWAAGLRRPAASLAARFAAKEAAMKALGVGLGAFGFHDVGVERAASGAPALQVTGRAAALAARAGVGAWRVSLTHTDTVATAVVLALG
ncbi:MAG TPA: holo-ACP synthase [Acidimicrobiales bacterium]|nr:holo-ACP synthase [Acidimicrobiales bacterium]